MKKNLKEAIEFGSNPDYIDPRKKQRIEKDKVGFEPLMPKQEHSHQFASKAYESAINKLKKYVKPEDMPNSPSKIGNLMMGFMQTAMEVEEIEEGSTFFLENLAVDTVLSLPEFKPVKDAVDAGDLIINAKIVHSNAGDIHKEDTVEKEIEQEIEAASSQFDIDAMLFDPDNAKAKRRFSNMMTQGAAVNYFYLTDLVKTELTEIHPDLPQMYGFINSVGQMCYWMMPTITDGGQAGEEDIEQDKEGRGVINARGRNFPLLIHELTKGILEYVGSYNIASTKDQQEEVLGDVDTLEHEEYDLMIGPAFWNHLREAVGIEDQKLILHVWEKILALPAFADDIKGGFASFIKEFVKDPATAKKLIRPFVVDIKKAISDFENYEEPEEPNAYGDMFESAFQIVHKKKLIKENVQITNRVIELFKQYPEIPEQEYEAWANSDPFAIEGKGFRCLELILKLKKENKIKDPRDIWFILKETAYTPQFKIENKSEKTAGGNIVHRTVEIPLTAEQKAREFEKNKLSSIEWVLRQILKDPQMSYHNLKEDMPKYKTPIYYFFRYKDSDKWPATFPKELQKYSIQTLSQAAAACADALAGKKGYSGKVPLLPDVEFIAEEGEIELLRIKPTYAGWRSLVEYNFSRGGIENEGKWGVWCICNTKPEGSGSWGYFTHYQSELLTKEEKTNKDQFFRNPPQAFLDDPLYGYYFVFKNGQPYAMLDFISLQCENRSNADWKDDPIYPIVMNMLANVSPNIALIVKPDKNSRPSNKTFNNFNKDANKNRLYTYIAFLLMKKYVFLNIRNKNIHADNATALSLHPLTLIVNDKNAAAECLKHMEGLFKKAANDQDTRYDRATRAFTTGEKQTNPNNTVELIPFDSPELVQGLQDRCKALLTTFDMDEIEKTYDQFVARCSTMRDLASKYLNDKVR